MPKTIPGLQLVIVPSKRAVGLPWLRIYLPMQGFDPLVRKLRSHMLWGNQAQAPQLEKGHTLQQSPSMARKKLIKIKEIKKNKNFLMN